MKGLLVINKPEGYTSRDVVNIVSHVLHEKRVGHTGTLDPLATGVLVICIGKYTKLVDLLTSLNKEYIAEIKLGIETDTLDITGNILKKEKVHVEKLDLLKVFSKFIGEYQMEVPKYSAIKVNGKKLYARNEEKVELPVKTVHIYELELLSFYQDIVSFRCLVEKGTYIRSLIRDMMKKLNIIGTMHHLVRTKQGNFKVEDAYSLEEIENNQFQLLSISDVLNISKYELNELEYKKVCNGNRVYLNFEKFMVLLMYHGEEIAIYQKDQELYKPYVMLI